MLSRAEVEQQVKRILVERGGIPVEHAAGGVRLVEDLGMDSLDFIEAAVELERQFGIVVSHKRVAGLGTLDELVDHVCGLRGAASARAGTTPCR